MGWDFAGTASSPIAVGAGSQTATTGTVVLSNSNGFTFGMSNSSVITASYSQASVPAAIVAGTQTATSGTVIFSSSNNVSFGMSGSNTITAAAIGQNFSYVELLPVETIGNALTVTSGPNSLVPYFMPFIIPAGTLAANTVRLFASRAAGTTQSATWNLGFYTFKNSTQISLQSSTSFSVSLSASSEFNGVMAYEFTGLSNYMMTQGRYVMGVMISASATNVMNLILQGGAALATVRGTVFPGANSTGGSQSTQQLIPFCGVYTTQSLLPAAVGLSEVYGNDANCNRIYALIVGLTS